MSEERRLVAEGAEEENVLWRVRQVILAADYVGDLHLGVVDHDGEVVQRRSVVSHDDEVATDV